MKKENLMFAVIGLLVGLIIGFMFANSVNRSAMNQTPPTASASNSAGGGSQSGNPALPADHPPIGTTGGDTSNAGPGGAAAIAQVSAAIEKAKAEPQNYEAQMTAGDLYYQIQRFEESTKFYDAASKLKPGDTESLVKLGNAYFDAEKYPEAEKAYTQVLEKDPKNINVRTDMGLTFFLREPRDIDRAIKEYKTSLSIDPNHEITLQNLALAYKEKGDTADYNATLDKLKKIDPNNPVLKGGAPLQ